MNKIDDIQIPNIELEIAKLSEKSLKKGEINACLFNLIIYSQDTDRAALLKEVIQTITETYPCRIMVIECDRNSKIDQLKVNVEHEIVKKNESSISCDRINIVCSSKYLNRVPYLLLPHLVPDLPIYLLWGQDPSQENEILPRLQSFATRLIFDSDTSSHLCDFCRKMLSDMRPAKIQVTDLNWASLTSWREILFQIFDTEEKIRQLKSSRLIKIRYNNRVSEAYRHSERRSIYLQGWLAAQLGWKSIKSSNNNGVISITYNNGEGETEIVIQGESMPQLTPGAIVAVEISTRKDCEYSLIRKGLQPFITAHISYKDSCEMPVVLSLRHSKKTPEFIKEMLIAPCSKHYWNMLEAIEPLQVLC